MPARGDVCDCSIIHEDIVNAVQEKMPEDKTLQCLTDFFKIFADASRIKILWALDNHEMCVCDLAVILNGTKSAVSHQLRTLRQMNLVKFRKEGKVVYYSLADDHVRTILEQGMNHISE